MCYICHLYTLLRKHPSWVEWCLEIIFHSITLNHKMDTSSLLYILIYMNHSSTHFLCIIYNTPGLNVCCACSTRYPTTSNWGWAMASQLPSRTPTVNALREEVLLVHASTLQLFSWCWRISPAVLMGAWGFQAAVQISCKHFTGPPPGTKVDILF